MVNYEQQTFDTPNPVARYAHRARFARSLREIDGLPAGSSVLDYGCGTGRFLSLIHAQKPGMYRLSGYDPFMAQRYEGYAVVSDPAQVPDASVDLLTCLEVCEHLDPAETRTFIDFAERKLKPGGRLLVTVPIMTGPVLLLKEMNRCLLYRRLPEHSMGELLGAVFRGSVASRAPDIKVSHKGYDFKKTRSEFTAAFGPAQVTYSPFPSLPWGANSQAFMTFHRPR